MCGIAGLVQWNGTENEAVVRCMTEALAHRGPDAGSVQKFGQAILGHRRLSVIDPLERSNQPMVDLQTGTALVFNGEIYNFREIRAELAAAGDQFATMSDTEVVLSAYRRWGKQFLTRLVGMFSLAIWDQNNRELLLARDRMGEKPLYYVQTDGGLMFASEMSALMSAVDVGPLSASGLREYLAFNYTLGSTTLFERIKRLEPAHFLLVSEDKGLRIEPYWRHLDHFTAPRFEGSYEDALAELHEKVQVAVKNCTIADVPLGAFLSGGLDSGVIVGALAQQADTPSDISTFSIGFSENAFDERKLAAESASIFGTDHHDSHMDLDVEASFLEIVKRASEPLADTSSIPFYELSKFAREHVTVCLSGDGADEMFAGYSTYRANELRSWSRFLPVELLPIFASLVPRGIRSKGRLDLTFATERFKEACRMPADDAHSHWRRIFKDDETLKVVKGDVRQALETKNPLDAFRRAFSDGSQVYDELDRTLYVDSVTWLACSVLPKVDRFSMAHSLEVRAPFLDHRIVEFAAKLPSKWKLARGRNKRILRDMAAKHIHPRMAERRKRGFNAPLRSWMRTHLYELGRDATHSKPFTDIFDTSYVNQLWLDHASGKHDNGFKLYGLTFLAVWLAEQNTHSGVRALEIGTV